MNANDKNNPSPSPESAGPSRRRFVAATAAMALGSGLGLSACGGGHDEDKQLFGYGVASGDPLSDRVIIWTRANNTGGAVPVEWQVATDAAFANVLKSGTATADVSRDYTVKVDVTGLQPATTYFYRFKAGGNFSPTGRTKTLPVGNPQQVKIGVFSCAAYSLGQFHAYAHAVNRGDLDVALMLGDYIYETGLTNVEQAAAFALGREADPQGELHTLFEYRQRYARYHTDADLRALRASMPIIAVWDDHEIVNDTWRDGAGGHDPATEGSFAERRGSAAQAWHEWLPTRDDPDPLKIYRSFDFGNLLSLHMLDTRVVGRDAPLNRDTFLTTADAPGRQLLGPVQAAWLDAQMQASTATYQVLGNQVLMGRMRIPLSVYDNFTEDSINEFLVALDTPAASRTPTQAALVAQPRIGYELTNWDGFGAAREALFASARAKDKNLVVVSGDSHNAWASNLKDASGASIGVEFGTPSVTSTGLEITHTNVGRQFLADSFVRMIPDLKFAETSHRGYHVLTLTPASATGEWVFVSSVFDNSFTAFSGPVLRMLPGAANRVLVPA
ncbi:alkaline phosphatase D family protein [Caenimonas aquaedulcis]|uniref:Alkaline phosphatase D family protein n=1 Tax=Caenimonas aquaedulcis TaxID=2793270 RepID=A0A931MGC5_9BURK|nr:alkaline phosphatase D family protein [Caenimonas aquaedulcis]MBG9387170.1 alkaline phosphatase D family protein [Caenimonas aquaedulcis]